VDINHTHNYYRYYPYQATSGFAGGGAQMWAYRPDMSTTNPPGDTNSNYMNQNNTHNHSFTTDNGTGSGSAFNILPPYLTVNYIIKY
jgi:hypothetical protein